MSAEATTKYPITWGQVDQAVNLLHSKMVQHNYKPRKILAVARGGVIPATMLSHKLGIREVGFIRTEAYQSQVVDSITNVNVYDTLDVYRRPIPTNSLAEHDLRHMWNLPDTLVVDDLWDTGKTHAKLRAMLPEAVFCTAFYRRREDNSHLIVSYPGLCLSTRDWIEFPWER